MLYRVASLRKRTIISRMASFTSTSFPWRVLFFEEQANYALTISAARVPSFTILMAAARASSTSG